MRRVLVVLNPSSHDFEAERRFVELEPILRRLAEVEVLRTTPDDQATGRAIQAALGKGLDRVVAIGGDGTAHLVLNALFAPEQGPARLPELAVIPFGTANDVAKSLRLPLSDLRALAEIAAGDHLGKLDIGVVLSSFGGRAQRRVFVDAVSIGMDADVLAARARYRELGGYLGYLAALAERAGEQESFDARVTVDGEALDVRIFNVVVNNVPVYAGELTMPGAKRDDGLLDVYLFDRQEYASKLLSFAVKQADLLRLGIHELLEALTDNQRSRHGREIRVRLASPRRVQVDGELLGEADEISCRVLAQLDVACPREGVVGGGS